MKTLVLKKSQAFHLLTSRDLIITVRKQNCFIALMRTLKMAESQDKGE